MAGLFIFPTHRLHPDFVTPKVGKRVVSGGVALSGEEDVVETDGGGRVEITYGDMASDDPQTERRLNAWDSYLAGGARSCLVPLVTLRTAPRPWANTAPRDPSAFGDDDEMFPTRVGYRLKLIDAITVGAAGLRATMIIINVVSGSPILGGEWFSIGERAYRVERVISRTGTQFSCLINPPLRAPVPEDSAVEFEWPLIRAKLAIGSSLVPDMTFGRYGDVSATFVEAL